MLQVYKRMFQGMFTLTFGEGAAASGQDMINQVRTIPQDQLPDFVRTNLANIKEYFSALDKNGNGIDASDMSSAQQRFDTNKLLEQLGMSGLDANNQSMRLQDILGAVENLKNGRASTINTAIQHQGEVSNALPTVYSKYAGTVELYDTVVDANENRGRTSDFVMEASTGDIATGETQRENEHRVLWVKVGSTEVNLENADKHVRLSSLNQVLSQHDAATILAEINANRDGEVFTDYLLFKDKDIVAVQNALESRGYDDRGRFGDKEAGMIYSLLSGVVESQSEVRGLTGMEKINRLLDVNQDGKLNAFTNAKYGEAQAASILEWMTEVQRTVSTEAQFNKLLRAININPVSFHQNLDTNFFLTRQNFAEALKANSAMVSSLSSLVGGKTAEFTMAQIEVQETNLAQVENLLLANQSVKDVMDALDPSLRQVELTRMAKDLVDFEGAGMLFTPHGIATAASATIANDYHASIGKIEWGRVAVTLERKVFGDEKTNVNVGVGTDFKKICIYVSGSRVLREGFKKDTVKNWTSEELYRGNGTISAHAVASLSGISAGLNFDKSKSAAIENQVATIRAELTKVWDALIANPNASFDSLGLEGEASDLQKNIEVFDMIRNRFNQDTKNLNLTKPQKKLYMDSIVAGYAQYIENNLYFGNEGLSLSGGGIGVLAGHPVVFASFEDINASWNHNDVNNSATAATYEATRERGFTENEIGAEKSNIGRFDTLLFRGMDPRNISAAPGTGVEIQHTAEGVHIAWNVTSIDLVRYVSPTNEKADILVINGWNVNGTEMVPGGYATDVASSIPSTPRQVVTWTTTDIVPEIVTIPSATETQSISEPVFNGHLEHIRTHIDANISVQDLYILDDTNTEIYKETVLAQFQKDVFDAGRELTTKQVNDFWKQLTTWELGSFMERRVGKLTANSEDEKRYTLNALMLALRNDNSTNADLDFSNSTSTITNWRTLNQYYKGAMEKYMISNIASARGISPETVRAAYTNLFASIGHKNSFNTQVWFADVVSSSGASQYLKGQDGKQFWIRNGVVNLSEGVHETIWEYVSVSLDGRERAHLIDNLPKRFLQRKVDAINTSINGSVTIEQLQDAMKNDTNIVGTTVRPTYYANMTLTWNCLNLQLDEWISLTKEVTTWWGTRTINREVTRNVTTMVNETNIQYGKASMDGYQTAEFDVNKYILWIVVDTKNDDAADTNTGTESEEGATTSTGTESGTETGDATTWEGAGWSTGGSDTWPEYDFGGWDTTTVDSTGWSTGWVDTGVDLSLDQKSGHDLTSKDTTTYINAARRSSDK